MNRLLLFFALLLFADGFAQQADFLKIGRYRVAYLNDSLKENSGLSFRNGRLYVMNDGGNSSEIFEIDKSSGKILKTIKTGLTNIDWEAIASDSLYFYTGDFGNNAGTRKNLKIYKIPYDNNSAAQEIPFFYPEQQDFSRKVINNDFDAEAMIVLNGKIHVFTKEWVSKSTTHYVLNPELADNQPAEKTESFRTGFVVTDAAYFDGKLFLIGYTKNTEVFLSVFKESEPGVFFSKQPKKYYLGSSLSVGQIEGIAVDESGVYISGEEFRTPFGTAKQAFYFIPADKIL
ncbi:YncE family protein [Chryseobacterium sp. HSC-36S06]|uniref:YncE family protein n=1 Tax=Chryseobacterium sp. HSC-36S06 TaxID=2910970 RepID=UPI0020A2064D|nr:hypothetical protein [Chryseobacterium sp. HSC-36S06]MCP2038403.1 hypothetical protein [Chryseobacterium sp. HSC-36S06]